MEGGDGRLLGWGGADRSPPGVPLVVDGIWQSNPGREEREKSPPLPGPQHAWFPITLRQAQWESEVSCGQRKFGTVLEQKSSGEPTVRPHRRVAGAHEMAEGWATH